MLRRKILVFVLILLLVPSVYAFTKVTGFVPGKYDEKRISPSLIINETQQQTFHIEMPYGSELLSLKISGTVVGDGNAMAVMDNDGVGLEIFNFNEPQDGVAEAITGIFTNVENALTGSAVWASAENGTKEKEFTSECIDTCYLSLPNKETINLFFVVEDGTTIKIDHIEYSYIPPSAKNPSWFTSFLSKILNIFR